MAPGSTIPTSPFASTAKPNARQQTYQPRLPARESSRSTCHQKKLSSAASIATASGRSEVTPRAKPTHSDNVVSVAALRYPVRPEPVRRPKKIEQEHSGRRRQCDADAGGKFGNPKRAVARSSNPVEQRGLLKPRNAVDSRCNPVACLIHFTRNFGVTRLVRADERQAAQPIKERHDTKDRQTGKLKDGPLLDLCFQFWKIGLNWSAAYLINERNSTMSGNESVKRLI